MTPQSMNELVAVLQRKKLIKKAVDPSHKRILRITLTAKGIQTLDACNRELDRVEESLLGSFQTDDLEKLRELIARFISGSRQQAQD
jgi:DNA-binding MarR family transcriptional regulator